MRPSILTSYRLFVHSPKCDQSFDSRLFNVSAQLQQTTRYQHEPIAVMCWHAFSDPVYITEVQSLKSIKLLYDSGI